MKFQITFKDPDGYGDGLRRATVQSLAPLGLEGQDLEDAVQLRMEAMSDQLSKWVKWQEYITIEFDPIAKTAAVVPNR